MPRYIIDECALRRNLEILKGVSDRTGVKILLAQKAFSCAAVYPLCAKYLAGTTASSLFEAKHGHDMFGGETHVFAPAFAPEEIDELLGLVDHIVFNSPRQVALYGEKARGCGVSAGLRVNPEVSVATTAAYDPCRPGSRLGVTRAAIDAQPAGARLAEMIDGLHFHCLCEQGVEELKKVLAGFEERFGDILSDMKWVNMGGGHHITRCGYDVDGLVELLDGFRARHPNLEVYLEPGEAVALDSGTLEARILEIQPSGPNGVANAILDASAACHMPDVIEMPYTPRVTGAVTVSPGCAAAQPFTYSFGGPTCLAGDVIGTYSFDHPLAEGDVVVFEDMAIYSMVKNNTFNGVNLPQIALRREDGTIETLRSFGYDDFACRLG
ncbi:MAG: carboxynorspermidine decarboxylase [Kiritimatiellae bacterium]|nr:carboxynorspermidine decarboxylase [Kiritimatiellia bacterium]